MDERKALLADMTAVRAHHAFTRNRIGQPGCEVRKVATEYVETIDRAIAALSTEPERTAKAVAEERDARLKYEGRDILLQVVWSLKPGQPQIVAICSSSEVAERYRPYVEQHHKGQFYVEEAYLDHAFGRRDVQTAIYRAAIRSEGSGV